MLWNNTYELNTIIALLFMQIRYRCMDKCWPLFYKWNVLLEVVVYKVGFPYVRLDWWSPDIRMYARISMALLSYKPQPCKVSRSTMGRHKEYTRWVELVSTKFLERNNEIVGAQRNQHFLDDPLPSNANENWKNCTSFATNIDSLNT